MAKAASRGKLRKTAEHSVIYAIGAMLGRITALVMLPIYTRYLSPSDYGVLELLSMAIEITGILVGLRISQAMFRFYILAESKREQQVIVSTVLLTVLAASSFGATVLYLAAEPLSVLIFGNSVYLYEFRLFSFTLITNAVAAVGLACIRARQMPVLFISIGAVTLALQVTLNIIFVVVMELHVRGVVFSALGSGSIIAIGFCLYLFGGVGIGYSRAVAIRTIMFLAPLILASIGAFFVAYANRYFLRVFGSLTEVGLYALAARLSSIIETLYETFNMSWSADRYEIMRHDNARTVFGQVFRFLSAILVLSGVGLALFASDFLYLITNPEYHSASTIVPLLVAAGIASNYAIFCNFGIMLNERTRHIAEATWLSVGVAFVGCMLLIPHMGLYGAALTLLACNLARLYWVNRNATREYDMELQWKPVIMLLAAGAICVLAGMLMPVGELIWFMARAGIYAGLIFSIYWMPIWQDSDRVLMKAGFDKITGCVMKR